jgi:3-oxoacyl-[acyl-carrier-protein] synthase II
MKLAYPLKKVVVTGLGLVTPLGYTTQATWASLLANESGITTAPRELFRVPEGKEYNVALVKDFPYQQYRAPHADNRLTSFLLSAAEQAIAQAKITLPEETGLALGLMSSNTTSFSRIGEEAATKGPSQVGRLSMLQILSNIPAAVLSLKYGLRGPTQTIATACASSASAILDGYTRVAMGETPVMLVGGAEDIANPVVLHSSAKLGAMTTQAYPSPAHASRPFDQARSGFVLGEGAGLMVLEEEEHARARNAKVLARIMGGCTTSDGFHLTRPADNGEGINRAMKKAIQQAGLLPTQIDLFNCHATSTKAGDELECTAIDNLGPGPEAEALSLKGHFGHTFGAAGVIEAALGVVMAQEGKVVGTRNL